MLADRVMRPSGAPTYGEYADHLTAEGVMAAVGVCRRMHVLSEHIRDRLRFRRVEDSHELRTPSFIVDAEQQKAWCIGSDGVGHGQDRLRQRRLTFGVIQVEPLALEL